MKQKNAKPRPAAKRKGRPAKRRRKLTLKDKIFMVSITGALVAAALALAVIAGSVRQKDAVARGEAEQPERSRRTEETAPPPVPEEEAGGPEKVAPRIVPAAPASVSSRPREREPAAAEQKPAETTQRAAPASQSVSQIATQSATRPSTQTAAPRAVAPETSERPPEKETALVPAAPAALPPERVFKGKLVFVIDDAGNNLRELEPFLKFPGPLTIAVLPGLPNSAEAARRIRAAGKEVFLHQPMESLGGSNPGPGAVYAGMEETEIRSIINRNLDEIWPVAGINNHEGSKVTMDARSMEIVLDICGERGIVFLDSRTTADTAAPAAAKRLGLSIGERDVFLDNEQSRASMVSCLDTAFQKAEQRGKAVMIGHTWSPQLAPLLSEYYHGMREGGFTLSTMSELIKAGK